MEIVVYLKNGETLRLKSQEIGGLDEDKIWLRINKPPKVTWIPITSIERVEEE